MTSLDTQRQPHNGIIYHYFLLFPLVTIFGMAAGTLFWEGARKKSVYRLAEPEEPLKTIYFKTFIPQIRRSRFRKIKRLSKFTLLFMAKYITESTSLDSQLKMSPQQ